MSDHKGVVKATNKYDNAAASGNYADATDGYEQNVRTRNTRTAGFVGVGVGAALTTTGVIFTVPMFR